MGRVERDLQHLLGCRILISDVYLRLLVLRVDSAVLVWFIDFVDNDAVLASSYPVGELLFLLLRHRLRNNHLHHRKLVLVQHESKACANQNHAKQIGLETAESGLNMICQVFGQVVDVLSVEHDLVV